MDYMRALTLTMLLATAGTVATAAEAHAQGGAVSPVGPAVTQKSVFSPPPDYVIGPEDVLGVLFWREEEMSGDVTVRPDGMITLPLVGDLPAAGLRPEALRAHVAAAVERYLTDARVTVVVREIKSRQIFITGQVAEPGAYPLTGPRTVMQAIALAGGLSEWADSKNIAIMRAEKGVQRSLRFNYNDVVKGRGLSQNVLLQPGDTIVVP